ncbi:protein-export chaperone SecB [Mucilaginibacter gossypii]|uniref:protein-export chaperone SecB n=1 Tax=Mucilaginibacter gossypii TaxID=551996 RepID=UPI000DCCA938|nr:MULTISPECIES: protein-export chaperone SecB [Mucilaginibacter]QTE36968.1 protein-export chaperone SecB [Mucilaginibacter gossypii]RAV45768.1 preprotein translocase subunit SecB [Mucilaginibacter rubeus]
MQITVEKLFVKQLSLIGSPNEPNSETSRIYDLKFDKIFPDENLRSFSILFKLEVSNSSEFDLKIQYECLFSTEEDITTEFKESHFPNINAPAIGFPFLRAYISYLLINSGFEPVLLPTINFTSFVTKEKTDVDNDII